MNFKKSGFFSENHTPGVFGAPGCHPSTLIDFINTALAKRGSLKTKCMISEGYRTHGGVTGPMKFKKKKDVVFFGKLCSRGFGTLAAMHAI